MSSFFEKCDEKKTTTSDWQAEGPPYIPTRYAELDAVISNRRLRNCIKDIESDTITAFPSDHFPVTIRVKIKLAKNRNTQKDESNTWKSPKKPTEAQTLLYNNHITTELRDLDMNTDNNATLKERINQKVIAFSRVIKTAAENHFEKRYIKKPDTTRSAELETLFAERQQHKKRWKLS